MAMRWIVVGFRKPRSASSIIFSATNLKLIEMAQANTEAVFELAHQIASVEAPSDLTEISAEHTRRQFELMTKQSKELTNLGTETCGSSD